MLKKKKKRTNCTWWYTPTELITPGPHFDSEILNPSLTESETKMKWDFRSLREIYFDEEIATVIARALAVDIF